MTAVPSGENRAALRYRRVLLKLSGEALQAPGSAAGSGIDLASVAYYANEIQLLRQAGCEIAVVLGAGNIFRGRDLRDGGMDRVSADYMGMLATILNCLALQDALEQLKLKVRVMSALRMHAVCESYIRRRALRHLEKGRVVLFAAGTGNPFFTTDTAASLRAVEIGADLMIKATKVDGVYSANPALDDNAQRFEHLDYDQVLDRRLEVIDATALVLCRDNLMPMRVIDMQRPQALLRAARGEPEGTMISAEPQT